MTYKIPTIHSLGKKYKIRDPYGKGYGKIVMKLLDELKSKHAVTSYWEADRMRIHDPESLVQFEKDRDHTEYMLNLKYKGVSPKEAREDKQVFLGSAHIISLLIQDCSILDKMYLDCTGDDYCDGSDDWGYVPYCGGRGSQVWCRDYWDDDADSLSGSLCFASGVPLKLDPLPILDLEISEIKINNKTYRLVEE